MARGNNTIRPRKIADSLHGNMLLGKLINYVMKDGKKSVAEKQVYKALEVIKSKIADTDPLTVFQDAVKNIAPQLEVRSRRIGGAAYQVPTAVRGNRKISLAIRWLTAESRGRSNADYHSFAEKLAAEIMDAYKNEGAAVKRRDTMHKMAEANRAFSHFRW